MKLLNFENGASLFTFDKSNIVWQYNFIIAILLLLKAQSEYGAPFAFFENIYIL